MVREEGVLYFSTNQLPQIIPEHTSRLDVEILSQKIGSGFKQYIHRFATADVKPAWPTPWIQVHTIEWLGGDRNGFLAIVQYHGKISVPVPHFRNERIGKMLGILFRSSCRLFPMPCHLPIESRNGSLVSCIGGEV